MGNFLAASDVDSLAISQTDPTKSQNNPNAVRFVKHIKSKDAIHCRSTLMHWLRTEYNLQMIEHGIPSEIIQMIIYFYHNRDEEWIVCGRALNIRDTYTHSSKSLMVNNIIQSSVVNTGKDEFGSYTNRASAYGYHTIKHGTHFWKLRVGAELLFEFCVGFVCAENGFDKAHGWYVTNEHAIGLYSTGDVWSKGERIGHCYGFRMGFRDIIHLCLDMDAGEMYAQRLEYKVIENDHKFILHQNTPYLLEDEIAYADKCYVVHEPCLVTKLNMKCGGYRLACYLRTLDHQVRILDYSDGKPFKEWRMKD